jgi:hypothetical protein
MSGDCGSCTACCTIMRVEMEPEAKPPGVRCQHLCGAGCAIYQARPEPCRVWSCVWLLSQERADVRLPSAMRPDRSGVVLEVNSQGNLVAHCETPAAWKREPIHRWLLRRAANTTVIIEPSREAPPLLLKADGSTRAMQFVGLNPATNERRYKLEGAR